MQSYELTPKQKKAFERLSMALEECLSKDILVFLWSGDICGINHKNLSGINIGNYSYSESDEQLQESSVDSCNSSIPSFSDDDLIVY